MVRTLPSSCVLSWPTLALLGLCRWLLQPKARVSPLGRRGPMAEDGKLGGFYRSRYQEGVRTHCTQKKKHTHT